LYIINKEKNIMAEKYKRVAIVTGATSGIGESIARKFINSGFAVLGSGRNEKKLKDLEKEFGNFFYGVAGNITDDIVIEKLFKSSVEIFGREADIVVANAGRGLGGSVTTADADDFENIMKINVSSVLKILQKAANKMIKFQEENFPEKAADIVIIGSIVGRHVSPFSAVYGATKFAVHALAEGLRREVGPKGVRVTLIEPAVVISGFQAAAGYTDELVDGFKEKFGPLLVGDDVANAVDYIVNQPPHVHISDIVIRPTRQDYP
jgi:NADP-dependent 3-hydroxy acid dehydrogenase YdfG